MPLLPAFCTLAVGAVLQGDATCVAAGLLLAKGKLPWAVAIAGCALGTFLGDAMMIAIGRGLGWSVLDGPLHRRAGNQQTFVRWRDWVERHSAEAAFLACFIPGVRTPLQWLLGLVCQRPWRLAVPLVVAAVLYASLTVGLAWAAARWSQHLLDATAPTLLALGLAVWCLLRLLGWLAGRWWRRTNASEDAVIA